MPKDDYRNQLKQEMNELIDRLDMSDLQKQFMKSRWLDQVLWLEGKSNKSRDRFYKLRMVTIVGGVIIPALVSLNMDGQLGKAMRWLSFGVSQAVAISAASEEFFRFGDRWQQYRNTAEGLKIEGWQFFQLAGPYQSAQNHGGAYSSFANRVEKIIKKDVEIYITELAEAKAQQENEEKQEKDKKGEKESKDSREAIKEVSLTGLRQKSGLKRTEKVVSDNNLDQKVG